MSSSIAKTVTNEITFKILQGDIPRFALKEREFGGGFVSMSPDVYEEFVSMVRRFPSLTAGFGVIRHEKGGSSVRLSFSGDNMCISVSFMCGGITKSKIVLSQEHVQALQMYLFEDHHE